MLVFEIAFLVVAALMLAVDIIFLLFHPFFRTMEK